MSRPEAPQAELPGAGNKPAPSWAKDPWREARILLERAEADLARRPMALANALTGMAVSAGVEIPMQTALVGRRQSPLYGLKIETNQACPPGTAFILNGRSITRIVNIGD